MDWGLTAATAGLSLGANGASPTPVTYVEIAAPALAREYARRQAQRPISGGAGDETKVDDVLTVRGKNPVADLEAGTASWTDVTATYGPTVLTAERLRIDQRAKKGYAEGRVTVTDPDGTLTANDLEFSWADGAQTGRARQVEVIVDAARLRAAEAEVRPGKWTLRDVRLSTCRGARPLYEFTARTITLSVGKKGRAERPGLRILGTPILTIPSYSFSLDRRDMGLRPPTISRRRDGKIGITWQSGLMLDDQTALAGNATLFPGSAPSYGLQATRSFVDPEKVTRVVMPESDTGERFAFGYFESVAVKSPEGERDWLSEERHSLSVGSLINQGVDEERGGDEFLTKPLEVTYERGGRVEGGPVPGGAYLAQTRIHSIQNQSGVNHVRATAYASYGFPFYEKGRARLLTRFDGATFMGTRSSAWIRSSLGLVYEPAPWARLGIAGILGAQTANPLFGSDALTSTRGIHGRIDLISGPTKVSFLQKWDPDLRFYDREFSVYQKLGCLEAFVISRQVPRVFLIGIRLDFDTLAEIVTRRRLERRPPRSPEPAASSTP